MQVTETKAEGLSRAFKVVVPAADIESRVQSRLSELAPTVKLPGFRPGHVPAAVLRKRFGPSVMGEVLDRTVNDTTSQAMNDRGIRPAETGDIVKIDFVGRLDGEPFAGGSAEGYMLELGSGSFIGGFEDQLVGAKAGEERKINVRFPDDYGAAELAGKDVEFAVKVQELMRAKQSEIDDALAKKLGQEDLAALKKAIKEEQERHYKGQARMRLKRDLLDALAKRHTFELPPRLLETEFEHIWKHFEDHRKASAERKQGGAHSHNHAHDHAHDHGHHHHDHGHGHHHHDHDHGHGHDHDHDHDHDHRHDHDHDDLAEFAGKTDDEIKAEFRAIAERRVRLGLLLAEVGRKNNVQVNAEDVNRAIAQEARRYPGQEQQVVEFYRKNAQAADSLRAPIFEEKVVDFILEMVRVTGRPSTAEELFKDPDAKDAAEPEAAATKKTKKAKKAES